MNPLQIQAITDTAGGSLVADYTAAPPTQSPRPVSGAERLPSIDLIRGFALLGILMMNIPSFGYLRSGVLDIVKHHDSWDYFAFMFVGTAFEGTMRGLFSMLFGAGMILFATNKPELANGPSVVEFYYRRLLWLVLFGLFDAFVLLWEGDILFAYGLLGMLLYPFRRLKPGWLLGLALCCAGIGVFKNNQWDSQVRDNRAGYLEAVKLEKQHKKPSPKQLEAKAGWETFTGYFKADSAKDAKTLTEMRGDYPAVFAHIMPQSSQSEIWTYSGGWDMLGMMFVGMALLYWGFLSGKLSTRTYAVTLLLGYGLGLPVSWNYVQFYENYLRDQGSAVDAYRVFPFVLYDIRRVLLAVGHASLLILIYRSGVVPWLMKALIAVGQMAFTNYLMQSLICTLFFNGYGLGYYGKLSYHALFYVVGAVWLFQLIASPIWLHYFRFGPLEWLWRSLTYWKPQPMLNQPRAAGEA
ncbi:DUF418 domain-containing protein [Larkinella ripae]